MWLQVLLNLSAITTDKRTELRTSAIQTIQRIFENYVDQLSSDAWMLCLRSVLFGMVESNLLIQNSFRRESQPAEADITGWNETTKTVLDSVSTLVSMCIDRVEDASRLGEAWSDLLDYFQQYFLCGSHALGSSVFTTITGVLSRIEDPNVLGNSSLLKTAAIWRGYYDHRDTWKQSPEDNQDAFVAYAESFKAIYRLSDRSLDPNDLKEMLGNLEASIVDSDDVPYSSDVDHMTALQALVMDCLSAVHLDVTGLPEFLMRLLSRFTVLPYHSPANGAEKRGPTFVALSKASMSLLQTVVVQHVDHETIYSSGAFLCTLTSLAKPIQEKYLWQREGKSPTLWQKATTTAVAILEPSLTRINDLEGESLRDVWTQIVAIANGITHAEISPGFPPATMDKDESFDISSFTKLRDLITLSLGSPSLPDALRRTYTRKLFETSIIHEPVAGEIPDLADSPLEDLYKVRLGRTDDPAPAIRTKMAYVCLSELFSLISLHDSSAERVKLAQAAAPYLILRAALPLREYIADHPLRGRMPQPESQRMELLYVLEELGKLNSEPAAIPDAPGVKSRHKKHLHRLYLLLVKAVRVARYARDVFEALVGLTDMVGSEFGVLDE